MLFTDLFNIPSMIAMGVLLNLSNNQQPVVLVMTKLTILFM